MAVFCEAFQFRCVGLFPLCKELLHACLEAGEFRVAEDGGLDISCVEVRIARVFAWAKETGTKRGHDFPVAAERVDIAIRDTATEVGVDVLEVFWFSAIDVAGEVEIVVVFGVADFFD